MPNNEIKILRSIDISKNDPYTIVIVSNPVFVTEKDSGNFKVNSIIN